MQAAPSLGDTRKYCDISNPGGFQGALSEQPQQSSGVPLKAAHTSDEVGPAHESLCPNQCVRLSGATRTPPRLCRTGLLRSSRLSWVDLIWGAQSSGKSEGSMPLTHGTSKAAGVFLSHVGFEEERKEKLEQHTQNPQIWRRPLSQLAKCFDCHMHLNTNNEQIHESGAGKVLQHHF